VVWPRIAVMAAMLALCGCAAQRAGYAAERDAPDLALKGPVRSVPLSSGQIAQVQQGIAASLKDPGAASFGHSYRAGLTPDREIVVCGYVNGKKFAGIFAKPPDGKARFLPIGISIDEIEEDSVKGYCRDDGIYLPQ
jgi:hypothetical protein